MSATEHLTDAARSLLVRAREEAKLFGHAQMDLIHVLAAALKTDANISVTMLAAFGINAQAVRGAVLDTMDSLPSGITMESIAQSGALNDAMEWTNRERVRLQLSYIGPELVLAAALRPPDSPAAAILRQLGADPGDVVNRIYTLMPGSPRPALIADPAAIPDVQVMAILGTALRGHEVELTLALAEDKPHAAPCAPDVVAHFLIRLNAPDVSRRSCIDHAPDLQYMVGLLSPSGVFEAYGEGVTQAINHFIARCVDKHHAP